VQGVASSNPADPTMYTKQALPGKSLYRDREHRKIRYLAKTCNGQPGNRQPGNRRGFLLNRHSEPVCFGPGWAPTSATELRAEASATRGQFRAGVLYQRRVRYRFVARLLFDCTRQHGPGHCRNLEDALHVREHPGDVIVLEQAPLLAIPDQDLVAKFIVAKCIVQLGRMGKDLQRVRFVAVRRPVALRPDRVRRSRQAAKTSSPSKPRRPRFLTTWSELATGSLPQIANAAARDQVGHPALKTEGRIHTGALAGDRRSWSIRAGCEQTRRRARSRLGVDVLRRARRWRQGGRVGALGGGLLLSGRRRGAAGVRPPTMRGRSIRNTLPLERR